MNDSVDAGLTWPHWPGGGSAEEICVLVCLRLRAQRLLSDYSVSLHIHPSVRPCEGHMHTVLCLVLYNCYPGKKEVKTWREYVDWNKDFFLCLEWFIDSYSCYSSAADLGFSAHITDTKSDDLSSFSPGSAFSTYFQMCPSSGWSPKGSSQPSLCSIFCNFSLFSCAGVYLILATVC